MYEPPLDGDGEAVAGGQVDLDLRPLPARPHQLPLAHLRPRPGLQVL